MREDANMEDINLAYPLEDGMKIHIPTNQEKEKDNTTDMNKEEKNFTEKYVITSSGVSNNKEEVKSTQNLKVNINTATQAQLETLPGIGSSTATKIITYRNKEGTFQKIEDIKKVNGIGEAKFEKMKDYITVK